jgi:hypothetical protein
VQDLPRLALSVRQPSAWAIIHSGKDIENRSKGSIRAGRMAPGTICIHAAIGLREDEYRYIAWRMQQIEVRCPPPARLPRGAIIGVVDVVEILDRSESPWFGGDAGLRLENPRALDDPIPAKGELGYFEWVPSGSLASPLPWMQKYEPTDLFDDLPLSFSEPPRRPWPKRGS